MRSGTLGKEVIWIMDIFVTLKFASEPHQTILKIFSAKIRPRFSVHESNLK